jgi:isoprenylcysteine carboxyl methyltransferase (ICMT) family protein YpbQ
MLATIFLLWLGIYFGCGLLFAIVFALFGVRRVDAHAAGSTWGFRLLIVPGAAAVWPLLLYRWGRGAGHPPEENTAHKCAARADS